jgi:hypothetical protein
MGMARTTLRDHEPHELWTNGTEFNEKIIRWAFEAYLGIEVKDPHPIRLEDEALADYAGRYETIAVMRDVTVGDAGSSLDVTIRPKVLTQLGEDSPDDPPDPLGILPDGDDRYVVTNGPAKGDHGYFSRRPDGSVNGMHVGGRYAVRMTRPRRPS